jgi:hypothetical protein
MKPHETTLESPIEDERDTPEYHAFVEECAKHCTCDEEMRPCDSCLAGGICDDFHREDFYSWGREDTP